MQPNTTRVYPRGFFTSNSNFSHEVNFTFPVFVAPGVANTIEIKWAVNKPYDVVCCAWSYNSIQLQQFTSYADFGYLYINSGWTVPIGYRLMTIYDCPQ